MNLAKPTSHFITAQDGLRLHVCAYGLPAAESLPVVCLPGLTRTAEDFHALASALASNTTRPRYVVALDYRGRGRSDYDRNPGNYNVAVELADVLTVLTALALGPAVFIGTSRGGILAMLLGAARPSAIRGVILNDIGPVIERDGLARIKSYVGRLPQPATFGHAADILRRLFGAQFPKLSAAEWLALARRSFREQSGQLVSSYDANLAKSLEGIDLSRAPPPLWKEFDALAGVPMLVIRGANSDLLSAETVAAMRARRPDLQSLEVPDQGHPPLLEGAEMISRVGAFVTACDQAANAR
jgi:pimeloyl-ACP methyl ester carboxylesterase